MQPYIWPQLSQTGTVHIKLQLKQIKKKTKTPQNYPKNTFALSSI